MTSFTLHPDHPPITAGEIMALHQSGIQHYGGLSGGFPHSASCVESKINAAWQGVHYSSQDEESALLEFAALLLFYLVKGHCFPDGNKRVSWMTVLYLLAKLPGLTLEASEDEAVQFVNELAAGHISKERIADWLAARLAPL